jgi:hypothetical protein
LDPEDFFLIGLIMAGGGHNGSTSSNNIESEQISKVGYKKSINDDIDRKEDLR